MTSHAHVRGPVSLGLALLAIGIAHPALASATAPAADIEASSEPRASVSMSGAGRARSVHHGRRIWITGRVTPGEAGGTARLEYASRRGRYVTLRRIAIRRDGAYRVAVEARRPGWYRVAAVAGGADAVVSAATDWAESRPLRLSVIARVTAHGTRHLLGGGRVEVRGRLRPARGGLRVALQLRTSKGWRTLERSRTRRHGRFGVDWRPPNAGAYRLRVRFPGARGTLANSRRLGATRVYRSGHASWYGPGLYGNSTACGGALTPSRLGVAHRWLPCGTRVTFRFRGRSVTVPVIDRGPFVAGREWDLTAATKARLGFGDVGTVWSTP